MHRGWDITLIFLEKSQYFQYDNYFRSYFKDTMQKEIRRLIAENRLEDALRLLESYAQNEVILLQGRLSALNRQNNMGLLNNQEYSLERNKITFAALELVKMAPASGQEAPQPPIGQPTAPRNSTFPIFFSYAWDDADHPEGHRESLVNRLYDSLKADGFELKRDKMDLQYRGFISDFMRELGRGGLIVVALSDKYLRSPYCMHELNEIFRNSRQERDEFAKRIFPIRVEEIRINDPIDLGNYLTFWDEELKKWKELVKNSPSQLGRALFDEYEKIKEIHANCGELLGYLRNMNTLTTRLLAEGDFAIVKEALRRRIQELASA